MATLSRIQVYPIKSLDAVELNKVKVTPHGMLENDRCYALFEGNGNIIKAKDCAELHQLRAKVNLKSLQTCFQAHGKKETFHLEDERVAVGNWLSQILQRPVKLQRDDRIGFADDWTATGPTLISTATLEAVASWFDDLSVEEIRKRLRTNLEVEGVPAFWEDQLYGPKEGDLVSFRVGNIELFGKNACQRCPVPTRDMTTGEKTKNFSKTFVKARQENLPPWAHRERFDHFYRVSINTLPGTIGPGAQIQVGDEIEILGHTAPVLT